jgi:hypothetical protein
LWVLKWKIISKKDWTHDFASLWDLFEKITHKSVVEEIETETNNENQKKRNEGDETENYFVWCSFMALEVLGFPGFTYAGKMAILLDYFVSVLLYIQRLSFLPLTCSKLGWWMLVLTGTKFALMFCSVLENSKPFRVVA